MVDNQHKQIKGYRDLTVEEITAMNHLKELESLILDVVEEMQKQPDFGQRWISIGLTHIEQGFMALNRAIAKPQRVKVGG